MKIKFLAGVILFFVFSAQVIYGFQSEVQLVYSFCVQIQELFKSKHLPCPESPEIPEDSNYFSQEFVEKLRSKGYPVGLYSLLNKDDILKIPVFLTKIDGKLSLVKNIQGRMIISQTDSETNLSYEQFLKMWKSSKVVSPFICNIWYSSEPEGEITGSVKIIYSYHDMKFQELLQPSRQILEGAKDKPPLYVDELGLIPFGTIENYRKIYNLDEKQTFEKCKEMLEKEVENLGKGIPIYDPLPTYNSLYKFLAENKVNSVMEDLNYENWKKIVKFDAFNFDILANRCFLKGDVNNYMKFKKLYCFGFWEFNVKQRDSNFVEQLINLIKHYPQYAVFTIRGIGHFGMEEKLAEKGIKTQFILLGKGLLEENLINQQIMQVYFSHHITLSKDNIFRMILEAQIEELLRVYFYNNVTKDALTATQKVRKILAALDNETIFKIFAEVKNIMDDNPQYSQDKVPELIWKLIQEITGEKFSLNKSFSPDVQIISSQSQNTQLLDK